MKKLLLLSICLICGVAMSIAQSDKSQRKSPPIEITKSIDGVEVTIDYSSPRARGRKLFGALVPYDQVWRTGANEATKITLTQDAMVNDQKLLQGTYALFTVPGVEEWTIIFNTVSDQWGAYDYDASKDVLNVKSHVEVVNDYKDQFAIDINEGGFVISWGRVEVPISISSI